MSKHVTDRDIDAILILVVLVVSAILVLASVVGMQAWYYYMETKEFDRKVVSQVPAELYWIRVEQQEALTGYRWVDPEAGTVTIPIERAMEIVAEKYGEQ